MEVILIAAITTDGYIARHHHEVIQWSKDLSLFKELTWGWPVIIGANTKATLDRDLIGRELIVVHRSDDPQQVLNRIKARKCFVAGGGKTNARFAPYLTQLFLTIHPLVFGRGVPLFDGLNRELNLTLEEVKPVSGRQGIYQFRYRTNSDIGHIT
ncbi:MAG: dihydrofolate reductase family protein [Fidelibacterota bacterium]